MKKFLYFATGAVDGDGTTEEIACFAADRLSHFELISATSLDLHFDLALEQTDGGADNPVVRITITTGKHKEAIEAITGAIGSASAINAPMIVVADSQNSKFLTGDIEACAAVVITYAA